MTAEVGVWPQTRRSGARVASWLFERTPKVVAAFAFAVGGLAILSAANPDRAVAIGGVWGGVLSELPNFAAAGGGLALMTLAVGLRRRLEPAFWIAVALSIGGAAYFGFAQGRWKEAFAFLILLAFLVAARRAFYRRSALADLRPGWRSLAAAGGALLIAAAAAALWAGHHPAFEEAPWWALVVDPIIGRAGRPVVFALTALGFVAMWRGIASPARPRLPAAGGVDLQRVRSILEATSNLRPESALAYARDKSFLFDEHGQGFLMHRAKGGSLIAMGGPFGSPEARPRLLAAFQDLAAQHGLRPAIYAAPPELLPDLLDAGFRIEKIGENAVIDLTAFSLSGRKREVIRRGRRKLAEREGAQFEMLTPPHLPERLAPLKSVSDAWLDEVGGEEKSFSLGRFDPIFLDVCPIGTVMIGGEVIAFGSLWVTPDKSWAAIDLMRYDPARQPTNTMDFLLVELILWAQREGYRRFDLSMAPLSGLPESRHAPLFTRMARLVYRHGERFYNFQGLRRFKEKFGPEWEPRYLAAPGAWSAPIVLAEAAMLTNAPAEPSPDETRAA